MTGAIGRRIWFGGVGTGLQVPGQEREHMEINAGDTAWVMISAALVMVMTPALALFYGGMVRLLLAVCCWHGRTWNGSLRACRRLLPMTGRGGRCACRCRIP